MPAGDRYVEVTLEDMERFLRRAYRALRPKKSVFRGEVIYDLNLSDDKIFIRIFTSIRPHSGSGAGLGEDAIRTLIVTKSGSPLVKKESTKIVLRTKNWRDNLQDRIEGFLENYEADTLYWKGRQRMRDGETPHGVEDDREEREVREEREREERERAEREKAEREQREREERERATPKPPSGQAFKGSYRKLKNQEWGVQIWQKGNEGDEGLVETQGGGRRMKVRLVRRDWFGPDRYKQGNPYSEIWEFEKAGGGPRSAGEEPDDVSLSVAERFLAQQLV